MKYLKYLKYLLKHKYFVMVECFKEGLYWRGLAHDAGKFFPSEFFPFADNLRIDDLGKIEYESRYRKPVGIDAEKFDFARLSHQRKNKHHWQWWVLLEENRESRAIEMPELYVREMICDWVGAGKAEGKVSPKEDKYFMARKWYSDHRDKMSLNENTRLKIDKIIKWES